MQGLPDLIALGRALEFLAGVDDLGWRLERADPRRQGPLAAKASDSAADERDHLPNEQSLRTDPVSYAPVPASAATAILVDPDRIPSSRLPLGGTMAEDLLRQLPEAETEELLWLLREHYGQPWAVGKDSLQFPAHERYQLQARVSHGRIASLKPGPAFSSSSFASFLRKASDLLVQAAGPSYARAIFFTSPLPLRTTFRAVLSDIQLTPVPPEAPRPPVEYGAHPFVCEFRIRYSANGFVTNQRRLRSGLELAWILNALCRTRITTALNVRPRHAWVLDPNPDGSISRESVKWLQESYDIPGFVPYVDTLTGDASTTVRLVAHRDYYRPEFMPTSMNDVVFPDTLDIMLDRFQRLSYTDRRRFVRAALWVETANRSWDYHLSSWVTSMVAAVEALASPLSGEPSPAPRLGNAYDSFQAFLERYSPNSNRTAVREMYRLRSSIAHGAALLDLDEAPWAQGDLMVRRLGEWAILERLEIMVRDVLVNWLLDDIRLNHIISRYQRASS